MKPVLISRVVVPGLALAAHNVDDPRSSALVVALRGSDGWKVATDGGEVVAERLDERRAKALMLSTAGVVAAKLAAPLLSFAAPAPTRPAEVTACPF